MRYARVLAEAFGTPWAVHPDKLAVIEAFLNRRAAGDEVTPAEVEAAKQQKRPRGATAPPAVGLIQMYGTITQRADWLSEWSGGVSAEEVGRAVDELAASPSVEAIVLDIDSPGGTVYGIEQLALKVKAAAGKKKVISVANSLAASAAYWVASQASELVVSPDGEVGSIGVYLMHRDVSKATETRGERVTYVKAGRNKTAGNPYEPLGEEARAELQKGVDDYYDLFVRAVARGRNVTLSKVRDGFGQGGTVRAKEAVSEGMADRIGTLDDVLARYGLTTADVSPNAAAAPEAVNAGTEFRRRKLRLG